MPLNTRSSGIAPSVGYLLCVGHCKVEVAPREFVAIENMFDGLGLIIFFSCASDLKTGGHLRILGLPKLITCHQSCIE